MTISKTIIRFLRNWKLQHTCGRYYRFFSPFGASNGFKFRPCKKIPLIVATTGLSDEQAAKLKEASKVIPVLHSANMSLGVNLLIDLVQKAAKVLYSNFDIEIIERHHNQKIDAPSGTALALADAINQAVPEKYRYVYDRHSNRVKRSKDEIGIHSVRGGTIAGDHTVIFAGNDEIIELSMYQQQGYLRSGRIESSSIHS